GKPRARGDADALLVEERALAALGKKHLVVGRIVDQPGDDDAVALERDRDRELWNAVQEVRGAIERIDDPRVRLVGALAAAAFLAEEAVAGTRLDQFLIERFLGAAVGGGDEIRWTLERDLQLLEFAEVALERARSFARGRYHDIEQCGAEHAVDLFSGLGVCPRGSRASRAVGGGGREPEVRFLLGVVADTLRLFGDVDIEVR